MAKLAGIKGRSPEAYPPDNPGKPTIRTTSQVNVGPTAIFFAEIVSLLEGATPVDAGGGSERVIVMYSGALQWPASDEEPAPSTVTVGIYLDGAGSPAYSISVFLPASTVSPNPPQPVPFSLYWETPAVGAHAVDVKAQASTGTGATAVNGSLVLISTPV